MGDLGHRELLSQDFALINTLQVESALWADLPVATLQSNAIKSDAKLMPRLLALRAMSEDARVDLLYRVDSHRRYSRHPYFAALLKTSESSRYVVTHLGNRLLGRGPNGRQGFLRYFDPRTFQHLRWLLSEAQMNALLGPIIVWTWRATNGQWVEHHKTPLVPHTSLRFDQNQWDSLRRLDLLTKTLKNAARESADLHCDDQIAQQADILLRESETKHGLTDAGDRCLYAEQGIRFHLHIHTHPELAARLLRAREGATYAAACRDLDDDALRAFATELASPPRTTP